MSRSPASHDAEQPAHHPVAPAHTSTAKPDLHNAAKPHNKDVIAPRSRACPICGSATAKSFTVARYRLFVCRLCDFAFIDPDVADGLNAQAMFGDTYFFGGGAGYTNYLNEAELLRRHGQRYGKLLQAAGARRVLDVGAAAGFILRGMHDTGCDGVGLEPNASMAAYAAAQLRLDVRRTTLEGFDAGETFDAVSLLQVVDHLHDLRRSFARVRDLTKPGGLCLIEFGDRASVMARMLGPAWHEYAPPSVQRVFSLRALRILCAQYGFGLRSFGHPPKYLRADHALSLLGYKTGIPAARGVLARLAAKIPSSAQVRYFGDDITWALFEKLPAERNAA